MAACWISGSSTSSPLSRRRSQPLAGGKSDAEVLQWILAHFGPEPSPAAIEAWSAQAEQQAPSEAEWQHLLSEQRHGRALEGAECMTWFELLELHDRLSFSGQP